MTRHSYSIAEIRDMLNAQAEAVAQTYAPPVSGSYTDKGLYFTLNPMRYDRSVGSFCIAVSGPKVGRWNDYATGDYGDLIDLIQNSLNLSAADAIREARRFLGLSHDTPEAQAARRRQIETAKRRQAEAEAAQREKAVKTARLAARIFLEAQAQIRGTPVDHYLRGRGLDLSRLGRQPRSIRFHERCWYTHTDQTTGEVIEGHYPAMVAMVNNLAGDTVAVHRTYLAFDGQRWTKAPLPEAKKVLGKFGGCCIRVWSGTGPRGGKAAPLNRCPAGTHVYIAEGIEDALSAAMLAPDLRILAGISLSNMGAVRLPKNVSDVTIIGDNDPGQQARDALDRAVQQHAQAGRRVRLWINRDGKDLNDALLSARPQERRHG